MATDSSLEAQAKRALAFAEQRFLAGDIAGARRYAQHALSLAPSLQGAEQALVAYDVHAAAPDWHAVLGLGLPHPRPSGGDRSGIHDHIKRQHRRLCLLVHPDKNPSAAADGAFKIVQAAYDDALSATQAAEAAARTAWEDEAAVSRFWQTTTNDITPPVSSWRQQKQPPISRPAPPPRWAPPPPVPTGPPPSPPPPSWAQGVMSGKPYCPYYPFCWRCRLYASTAPMSGNKLCCSLCMSYQRSSQSATKASFFSFFKDELLATA